MAKEEKKKAPKGDGTLEDAQKKSLALKEQKGKAWKELSGFRLKNKYKKDEKFKDKAIQKKHDELEAAYKTFKAAFDKVEETIAALKPQRERNSKYTYPKDCVTPDQKKKFRAQQRSLAKGEAKAEKKAKKKEEAPAKEADKKSSKKEDAVVDKKAKKKKAKKADD